jgi:hypothetical protein
VWAHRDTVTTGAAGREIVLVLGSPPALTTRLASVDATSSSAGLFVLLHSPGTGDPKAWRSQWVIETLALSVYAGVFQCRVSRGRAFNFLATVSNWAWLTAERSTPLG